MADYAVFPLRSLPLEIRDQIYDYVVGHTYHLIGTPYPVEEERPKDQLAILQTSRAVSAEATEVLYRKAWFQFTFYYGPFFLQDLQSHPLSLQSTIDHMQNLRFDLDMSMHGRYCHVSGNPATGDSNFVNPVYMQALCEATVNEFKGCKTVRKEFHIIFRELSQYSLAILKTPFFKAIGSMSGFEKLVLEVRYESIRESIFDVHDTELNAMVGELKATLGPSSDMMERHDRGEDAYARYVEFHPRLHWAKVMDRKAADFKKEANRLGGITQTLEH